MAQVNPAEIAMIQQGMTDQQKMMFMSQYNSDKKDRTTALILSLILGTLGVDRFFLGDTGMGILKLCTFGLCGVMTVIDWFLIMGKADEYNRQKMQEIATTIKASA